MVCNCDLPLAAGRIKLRISNMWMSHNVPIDFLCRALREFILCFHFVLIGPYFYSICPYIALWRHLALKTRHLASRHLALKRLVTLVFTLKIKYFFYLLLSKVYNAAYSSSKCWPKYFIFCKKKFIYCPIRGQKNNRWFNPEYKLDQYMGYQIQAH